MNGSEASRPSGNSNYAYLNDPGVNAELKRLAPLPDRVEAGVGYGNLDEKIMTEQAPMIPVYMDRFYGAVRLEGRRCVPQRSVGLPVAAERLREAVTLTLR